jgi:hypothetical protein
VPGSMPRMMRSVGEATRVLLNVFLTTTAKLP